MSLFEQVMFTWELDPDEASLDLRSLRGIYDVGIFFKGH